MSDVPPISGRVDLDTTEARREVDRLRDDVQGMDRDFEQLGDTTELSSRRGIGAITELRSAFGLLGGAIAQVQAVLEDIDRTIEETARRSSELQQVSQALAISPREAQALTTLGAAVGVDAGDIRGFFDPLQEFGAEAVRRPDDPALQERVRQLEALGFDPSALAGGGFAAIEDAILNLGGLSTEERAVLPAFGVSIEDVQRLTPFAQRFSQGFDVDFFEGLGIPQPIDLGTAADAELERLQREAIQEARGQITAGVRDPQGIRQQAFRIPGSAQLAGFTDRIYDLPGFSQAADIRESLFGLIGLSGGDGFGDVSLNVDGEQINASLERRRELGG